MNTLNPKPIQFKFGEYISWAIDLMKKDFGTILLSFICAAILSIIPFCGFMALGNFYKICYKIDQGIPAKASEVFEFEDFMPYFIFQLYIIGASLVVFIPFILLMPAWRSGDNSNPIIFMVVFVFIFAIYFVLVYFLLQAFYIPGLITFKKITDIKTAWNISRIMTKGNLLQIFFFSLVVSFLSQLGILACFVGLIFTMPLYYVAQYFAFKDGLGQIE